MKYVTQKTRKNIILVLVAIISAGTLIGWQGGLRPVLAQSMDQMSVSLTAFDSNSEAINGTFSIRFAIYNTDRRDGSTSETNGRLWEETKQIEVKKGIIQTALGDTTAFPTGLFSNVDQNYYLGVRIDTDSEMVPRRKITSVASALNASNSTNAENAKALDGRVVGTGSDNIPVLGANGVLDISLLPTGSGTKQLVLGGDGRLHQQNTDDGTDSRTFDFGSGTRLGVANFDLAVSNASAKPTLRYDSSAGVWQLSNDGSTYSRILTGSSNSHWRDVDRKCHF